MTYAKILLAALTSGAMLIGTGAALAQDTPVTIPEKEVPQQSWTFAGPFGTFDRNQLRRGFQVFKEVCSNCHSANLLSFRNLEEPGGPEFSAAQVKALAATYTINDPTAKGGTRPGVPSDNWPSPFPTEQDARDANGGALPPDFSVLAKARSIHQAFPFWVFNYFTTYAEGGPDYIHAILTGFHDNPPAGFKLPEGKYYNDYFPGHAISMPPPLKDGLVNYTGDGTPVPQTVDQYAKDVASFMAWVGDPQVVDRKSAGFRVVLFLILFAVMMAFVKKRIWANAH
jgi:ubiquinol-cytochrome c reductase cytochrome c1 subunit